MLHTLEGGGVLLLLSAFFAYVLAPAVAALRRRVRIGPRQRPLSPAVALAILYALIFVPGALVFRGSTDRVTHWVQVTAPDTVAQLFGTGDFRSLDRLIADAPLPPAHGASWSNGPSASSATSTAKPGRRSAT